MRRKLQQQKPSRAVYRWLYSRSRTIGGASWCHLVCPSREGNRRTQLDRHKHENTRLKAYSDRSSQTLETSAKAIQLYAWTANRTLRLRRTYRHNSELPLQELDPLKERLRILEAEIETRQGGLEINGSR